MIKNNVSSLSNIFRKKTAIRKRISSYDITGGNDDRFHIKPNESRVFAEMEGPGIITHIWMTLQNDSEVQDPFTLRKVSLSFFWDDEKSPSVLAPVGDFFGMGHAMSKNFVSEPLQMSPEDGKGFNCWWPMPFRKKARLVVTNETDVDLLFYFYVDYEARKELPEDTLYFHAQWNRECPTDGISPKEFKNHHDWCFGDKNKDGKGNYLLLEAEGKGHYVGCNVNIHNLNTSNLWDWPGEGDDMIFIDGELNPSIHGTGTEDYVNMAWCPQQEYQAPYHGLLLGGSENWKGKISYYRYHIRDPIMFEKSIKVTIEHGHANHRSDDWTTTAYWYQSEPHKNFSILPVEKRMPVDEDHLTWTNEVRLHKIERRKK